MIFLNKIIKRLVLLEVLLLSKILLEIVDSICGVDVLSSFNDKYLRLFLSSEQIIDFKPK